ncbi:hypothetical protein [Peribacillus loiseleuriae]|uniref:hypothetical protein n=1 Tax=Peribacillus loiseleuriae TaxID=1679170 RepID=UPI000670E7FF|nr:hypothetical protein [Peribacillus loiseleuriae]
MLTVEACFRDFYSAEDVDSEGIEGEFYVWISDEVQRVLGEELGRLYCDVYDITDEGNFEGKNIPNLIGQSLNSITMKYGLNQSSLLDKGKSPREQLFLYREKRHYPHKDDKILTT